MPPSHTAKRAAHRRRNAGDRGRRQRGNVMIFGLHSVAAALTNPARTVERLLVSENAAHALQDAIAKRGIEPEICTPNDLARTIGSDTVHQGAVLLTSPLEEAALEDFAPNAGQPSPLVVALDQVTDPHNVGAIIRSATVFGATGLFMTRRNAPPLCETTAKAASGALEHLPIALASNLAQALRDMGRIGFHIIGLDGEGPATLTGERTEGPTVLVLGAEGTGLRRLTRETCDEICHLQTAGPIASLNVSNAAAVALSIAASVRTG